MTPTSKLTHSVRNPIQTERHVDWKDDMERAHYVVLVRTKHENWLRKYVDGSQLLSCSQLLRAELLMLQ